MASAANPPRFLRSLMKILRSNSPLLTLILLCSSVSILAQSADRTTAFQLFQAGDYSNALKLLKKVVKESPNDGDVWYRLGASYLKTGKYKDSVKALQKATEFAPKNDTYHALLAYTYLLINDPEAAGAANETLKIEPNNAEAHYVLGVISYRDERYTSAHDRAKRAIQIKPNFAPAYRLKAQSLIASFTSLDGKVLPPGVPGDLLPEAVTDLEKFLTLTGDPEQRKDVETELQTIRQFAEYYSRPENRVARDASLPEPADPTATPLKMLTKPRPGYTDSARQRNIQGTIRLRIVFDAFGKIGPILVSRSLDPELDRQAVIAARKIKFTPATKNGIPVTVVKQVEYTFSIY
jgi:TonB family protein